MQSTLSTYCRSRLKSLGRKSHSFSYIKSRILCMKLIGLHYSKITSKVTSFFARNSLPFLSAESLLFLRPQKSPFTLRPRESSTAPRISQVRLRSRAQRDLWNARLCTRLLEFACAMETCKVCCKVWRLVRQASASGLSRCEEQGKTHKALA